MRRHMLLTYLIFHFAALFWGCEQPATIEPSGKVIKIGILAPFSGSDAAKGSQGLVGARVALEIRPLLDNGDRIEIVTRDDTDDSVKSLQALRELVEDEQVAAVLTLSSSGPVLALCEVAGTYGTPILAALATHPDIAKQSRFVSQACFDNHFQGKVAALFVRDELLVDKVAVFQDSNSHYSTNLVAEFTKKFKALEGEITSLIHLDNQEETLFQTLKGVKEKDPQLLYLPVSAEDMIAILKELERLDWKPRLMAGDGLLATVFTQYREQLDLLDGLLATDFYHSDSRGTAFARRVTKVHKGEGTSYTALGVEGLAILLDAMNRCEQPTDKTCTNRQLRSTTDFEGIMGNISINADGKAQRPVIINAIQNGKLKYIAKVY